MLYMHSRISMDSGSSGPLASRDSHIKGNSNLVVFMDEIVVQRLINLLHYNWKLNILQIKSDG